MNTAAADTRRRRFLTRMFTAPDEALANTSLTTIPELRQQSEGVLWALAGDAPDNIFIAGDEGIVFHFDGEQWRRENLGSKLNVHALCFRDAELFSVGAEKANGSHCKAAKMKPPRSTNPNLIAGQTLMATCGQ